MVITPLTKYQLLQNQELGPRRNKRIQPFLELFLCKECNLLEIRQLQRPYTNLPLQFKTGESSSKVGGELTTLRPPTVLFKSCTGDIIQCWGEEEMDVKLRDQVGTLLLRVVQGPSLLVRDMMSKLTLP